MIKAISVLLFGLLLAGCDKVKQDTPEATVTSVMKLYASGDDTRWVDVVDSTLMRAHARQTECAGEAIMSVQCDNALDRMKGCPVNYSACSCGERGDKAAAKATDFVGSDAYAGLKKAKLDPKSCTVTDVKELTGGEVEALTRSFWHNVCADFPHEDPIASAKVTCPNVEPLVFILHKKDGKWMLVGFEANTGFALWVNSVVSKPQ